MKELTELISGLEKSQQVDAVFITGSSALGEETVDSDIDIVVILRDNPKKIRSVYEVVGGKFADIFFFTTNDIEDIIKENEVPANGMNGMLVTWLGKSKIVFDKSTVTTLLKDRIENIDLVVSENEYFQALQTVSYSYYHNHRYYHSGKSEYLSALEIRLLQSVLEIFTTYFSLRKIPWRGEKHAAQTISKTSSDLYEAWKSFLASNSIDDRMRAYETMVKELLKDDVVLFGYQSPIVVGNSPDVDKEVLANEWKKLLGE